MSTIPVGYKQTEIGVIPEDWEEHTIGELIEFEGGSQPDKSFFRPSWKQGYIRLIQIRDYKTDKYETYVPTHLARRFCTEQDIMIGRYGPPVFQILRGIEGAYNVALIKAKPSDEIHDTYAYYFLKQDKLFDFIEKLSQRSSGQTGVDLKELREYPLSLPSYTEQQAIATALSDTDALIESLEKLIAKKRQIKQGAMQELLTGKKRLVGFSGEWENVTAGEIGSFRGGCGFPIKYQGLSEGNYPFYKVSDMNNEGNTTFMNDSNNWISEKIRKSLGATVFPANSIVFAKVGAAIFLERKKILLHSSCIDNNLTAYTLDNSRSDYRFIHYLLLNTKLGSLVAASALPSLNGKQLAEISFTLPPLEEQTAIAKILSDMDAEITVLEERLEKTRTLKSGMMHELLTGRIRLI